MENVIKIYIERTQSLDPVTVYPDGGRVTVICFCDCWTHHFGSFTGTLLDFLKTAGVEYLSNKLQQSAYRSRMLTKVEKEYVDRVTAAVLTHLKTV